MLILAYDSFLKFFSKKTPVILVKNAQKTEHYLVFVRM